MSKRLYLLPAIAAIALTGCTMNWNPSYMPSGYKHHHKAYNGPEGREAPDIGYEYSEEQNEANLLEWRYALRDLILKARANNLELPKSFNLKTDLAPNAFQSSFDYILREGLREYGHILTTNEDAPVVFYTAIDPDLSELMIAPPSTRKQGEAPDLLKEKYNPESFELILATMDNGKITGEARGEYKLPVSGYEPLHYVRDYENPLKQKKHKKKSCGCHSSSEEPKQCSEKYENEK